jgi:carboxyl-terminal processing protease
MSKQTRWFVWLVSTPLVALVTVGGLVGAPQAAGTGQAQPGLDHLPVFRDVLTLVIRAYVEDVDVDKVMDGAMRGMAEGLDISSAFLLPDEVRAIDTAAPLPAGDVGLVVVHGFWLRVLGVRDGSPAARAGLQSGDYVRMIDAKPTRDMSSLTGMRLLRGAPGSKVSVTVIRGNTADPHVIDLVREAPKADLVKTTMTDGVARVRVSSFAAGTADALRAAFDELVKNKTPGAVIDLRGVADGTPDDGMKAARLFVKTGTIAVRAGRTPGLMKITAGVNDGSVTLPVVLLVSNGTANAAEVFAAALQGNKRAEMVGEPTAGVAALQKLVKLTQGYGLWLTYERYMTVDGKTPIHERGLAPDVPIQNPIIGFDELPPTTDAPLAKAVEQLKAKK